MSLMPTDPNHFYVSTDSVSNHYLFKYFMTARHEKLLPILLITLYGKL